VNLQRLLFERIDQRILIGTLSFLGIIVLVGWIAINEGGRMQAFDRQYAARSIERGATLFSTNCSECHGQDGRGSARAPALNSPYLFGHDFIPEINAERRSLAQRQTALGAEMDRLTGELTSADLTDTRRAEIDTRMTAIADETAQITARLAELDTEQIPFNQQMQAAIDRGYNPNAPSRLENLGWAGGLERFIYTTLVHGRPTSGAYWPEAMPAWSQLAGGPLRDDELQDLANYVLNWDKGANWTLEDLLAVNQFPIVPGAESTAVEGAVCESLEDCAQLTGPDLAPLLEGLTGDPQAGETLYNGALGCFACHTVVTAPSVAGTWTRVEEVRLTLPQFEGYTGELYLAESIVNPNHYVVPEFNPIMPPNFGTRITSQQLADLIAYLHTQDQPIE
jgi:mono/diheme cytochrome c family protein